MPEDGSWQATNRLYLYDDDEPDVHSTLIAQTRIGTDSVTAIPVFPTDSYNAAVTPDFSKTKEWALRAVSLSRKAVIKKLRSAGIPEGWKKNPLLRNSYPMILDNEFRWIVNKEVFLDRELGIVYEPKEDE